MKTLIKYAIVAAIGGAVVHVKNTQKLGRIITAVNSKHVPNYTPASNLKEAIAEGISFRRYYDL